MRKAKSGPMGKPEVMVRIGTPGLLPGLLPACRHPRKSEGNLQPRLRGNQGLWLGEVQQHHIRTFLHSFETTSRPSGEMSKSQCGSRERNESTAARCRSPCRSAKDPYVEALLARNTSARPPRRKSQVRAPRVRVRAGRGRATASVVTAFTEIVVTDVGSRVDNKRPSGAHTGSTEYSWTKARESDRRSARGRGVGRRDRRPPR